jgi:hypothetical protein
LERNSEKMVDKSSYLERNSEKMVEKSSYLERSRDKKWLTRAISWKEAVRKSG